MGFRAKVTAAAVSAIAAGGLALAAAPAHAASLPSCAASTHCTDNTLGEAGYYGADDGHTNYRFTETTVTASASLKNLNGASVTTPAFPASGTSVTNPTTEAVDVDITGGTVTSVVVTPAGGTATTYPTSTISLTGIPVPAGAAIVVDYTGTPKWTWSAPGAVGTELCDPNTGDVAQIGLSWSQVGTETAPQYNVSYAYGNLNMAAQDPCIQDGFAEPLTEASTLLSTFTINQGDVLYVGAYYDPSGSHVHQMSFGVCDETQDVCRQYWFSDPDKSDRFYEFGTGGITNAVNLTAPADIALETFTHSNVTCYSCKSATPLASVVGVYGYGGLTEAQFQNSSAQTVMSPSDSLSGSTFTLSEGSTSS